MTNYQLAPLPAGIRSLTNPESERLRQQYPRLWADPSKTCLTCTFEVTGTKTFKSRVAGVVEDYATFDCNCADQWRLNRWLLNAGIGVRYQRLSWDDVRTVSVPVQEAVMGYTLDVAKHLAQGAGLTLWSPNRGTGKTLLATLLAKAVLAAGYDGYFIQFNEMLDAFSAGWRNEEERAWFIRRVRNAQLLVVDDMGREHKGRAEVAESMFDTVIRARVAGAMPTIITTNYTQQDMLTGYGPNVLSLLSEVNEAIEVSGVDYRPQMASQDAQDRADGVVRPLVIR